MKLTREQRKALFAGVPVKLTFPGEKPCPVQKGHVEVLSANVRLEITAIRRTRLGDHSLVYVLYNDNLGQRFLAKQQGQAHPESYVSSSAGGIDQEAGEAVDAFTQRRITQEAHEREREAQGELVAAAEDLRSALAERIESSPDFMKMAGRDVWLVRSKLDRLIRNARRKAA